jgi:hypothetical protein
MGGTLHGDPVRLDVTSAAEADDERAIRELIAATYAAMSSDEPGTDRFFAHPDISIAGSGQGELVSGPEMAARMAEAVTRLGYRWTPETVTIWVRATSPGLRSLERSRSTATGSRRSCRTGRRASSAAKAGSGRGDIGAVPNRRRSHGSRSGTRCRRTVFTARRASIRARDAHAALRRARHLELERSGVGGGPFREPRLSSARDRPTPPCAAPA